MKKIILSMGVMFYLSGANAGSVIASKSCQSLDIKVFLEGTYNPASGQMDNLLNSGCPILPGLTGSSSNYGSSCPYFTVDTPVGQPYKVSPWNYSGNEGDNFTDNGATSPNPYPSDTVDWVLVSVRKNGIKKSHQVFMQAALLMRNGKVKFVSNECFNPIPRNRYYIVVEHRSHMRVMSHKPLVLPANGVSNKLVYDFSAQNSYRISHTGQKLAPNGKYVLASGDLDQNGIIESAGIDSAIWESFNGIFADYWHAADLDLNQDTNFSDLSLIQNNNDLRTDVSN